MSPPVVQRHFEDDGPAVDVVIGFARPRHDVKVLASVDFVGGDTDASNVEYFADLQEIIVQWYLK